MTYRPALAVAYARQQVGKPYQWGGAGPNAFDCSGLVEQSVLAGGGPLLPHQSGQQAAALHAVANTKANRKKVRPGDVAFYYGSVADPDSISHVALVTHRGPFGGLLVIAAVDEQYGVKRHRLNWALKPVGFGFVGHD